jgi:phospholipid-binding lipoprotein MlaA
LPTRLGSCALALGLALAAAPERAAFALAATAAEEEAVRAAEAELYADPEPAAREPADPAVDLVLALPEPDPLEGMNRALFGFNEAVDRYAMEPVARAYGFVFPGPVKRAMVRVFTNLNAPVVLVNDVLQLSPRRAADTLARFVVNTTVGLVGIFDVASRLGIEGHHADFGQTLGFAGVPTGPYLVLPVVGPSSARDAVGGIVDLAFRPQTYFLGPIDILILDASGGVATREAYIDELEKLRASSLDFYVTMRNVYFQRRAEMVREARAGWGIRVAQSPPARERDVAGAEAGASTGGEAPAAGSAAPPPAAGSEL